MKAKEYVEFYEGAKSKEGAQFKICEMLVEEVLGLMKQRHSRSVRCFDGVAREINDKWLAICARCPAMDRKIFGELLREGALRMNIRLTR